MLDRADLSGERNRGAFRDGRKFIGEMRLVRKSHFQSTVCPINGLSINQYRGRRPDASDTGKLLR